MHLARKLYQSTLAFKAQLLTLMPAMLAITVLAFATAPAAHAEPYIPLTLIDKAGNANHTTGFGAVDYNYYIGTTEVTNAQYAEFLNSVAKSDPNGLYNENMGSKTEGGITRSGNSGSYTYAVKSGAANKPVNYVSFFDALRFCNWLTNGATSTADTETGMYKLADGEAVTRNANAWEAFGYAVTSENEWYKAAYYNLATETYTLYATGDTWSSSMGNQGSLDANASPVAVGSYAAEQNGTYDMMGNVWEWNEAIKSTYRGIRGSAYAGDYNSGHASTSDFTRPKSTSELPTYGFRIAQLASVPEPSTYGLMAGAAALLGAIVLHRRPRRH